MVLTDIGEIGINADGRDYLLRPSLYAMTQLGEPEEIVRVYASVMSDQVHSDQFWDALTVLYACAGEDDISDVFGYMEHVDGHWGYREGGADRRDVLPLARCLMKHGIIGDYDPLPVPANKNKEYVTEFKARDHVATAVAHLGVTSREAWQMTMTEVVGGLRAKYPEAESQAKKEAAQYPNEDDMKMLLEYHNQLGGK